VLNVAYVSQEVDAFENKVELDERRLYHFTFRPTSPCVCLFVSLCCFPSLSLLLCVCQIQLNFSSMLLVWSSNELVCRPEG